MPISQRLLALFTLILAGLLVACGTPEDLDSSDAPPSRAELIARLQSPSESDELDRFRLKTEMNMSSGEAMGTEAGSITMHADVQLEPPAAHTQTASFEEADPAGALTHEMIIIGDQIWVNFGDGWNEIPMEISNLADWLLELYVEQGNPTSSIAESPEVSRMLEEAEIVGVEEVNGRRTTHFRLSTETVLMLLVEAFEESAASGDPCDELDPAEDGARDLDDGKAMAQFFECMGGAFAGELPSPDEYIERAEIDLWISDDGLMMRQELAMELTYLPLTGIFAEETADSSLAFAMTFDLYDLNAAFEITPPGTE